MYHTKWQLSMGKRKPISCTDTEDVEEFFGQDQPGHPATGLPAYGRDGGKEDSVILVDFQRNDFCDEMKIVVTVKEKKVVLQSNLRNEAVNGAPYGHPPFTALEKYPGCFGKGVDWVFGMKESLGFEVAPEQIVLFL
jgi:hypothetical protein